MSAIRLLIVLIAALCLRPPAAWAQEAPVVAVFLIENRGAPLSDEALEALTSTQRCQPLRPA